MKRVTRGFGLIEIMVAMVLGLIVSAGIVQIFIAAKTTYQSQNAAARMQEDARFVLSKLMQEIRMTGMYGCLEPSSSPPVSPAITKPDAFANPILWNNTSRALTLITADVGVSGGTPTWTVVSDCQKVQVYNGNRAAATGQTAFPLRQLTYTLTGTELSQATGSSAPQPLLSNVRTFTVWFGVSGAPMSYVTDINNNAMALSIRSVRLSLTLFDPAGKVRDQTYNVVAALRNRF